MGSADIVVNQKMLLNYIITILCILFIQIQDNVARDVVEEKQKLLKREREARKKTKLISIRIYQLGAN